MVTIYESMWNGGRRTDLGPGEHDYSGHIGSWHIPEGQKVTFHVGVWKRTGIPAFYSGSMPECYHLPLFRHDRYVIRVEETDVRNNQLCQLGWTWRDSRTSLDIRVSIPPGEYYGESPDVYLPNDKVEWLEVPASMAVTVWQDGGQQGSQRTYRQGRHELPDGLRGQVSSVKTVLDGWKQLSVDVDMDDNGNNIRPTGGTYILTGTARNDTDIEQEVQVTLESTRECGITEHWNLSSEITTSVEIGGNIGVAEVTAGLSVSIGAEYGSERSQNRGQTISLSPTVKCPPHTSYKCSAFFKEMAGTFAATRRIQNKETQDIITVNGTLECDWAGEYSVVWSKA